MADKTFCDCENECDCTPVSPKLFKALQDWNESLKKDQEKAKKAKKAKEAKEAKEAKKANTSHPQPTIVDTFERQKELDLTCVDLERPKFNEMEEIYYLIEYLGGQQPR